MANGTTVDGPRLDGLLTFKDLGPLERWADLWDRLASRASQRFAYVAAGWATRDAAADRLHVITLWRRAELIAAWPLYVARTGGLEVARHLGCGGREEYADPLISRSVAADNEVLDALLAEARRAADVLELYNLAEGGPMEMRVRHDARSGLRQVISSPFVRFSLAGNWDAWLAGKSKSFRAGLKYDRKRLAAKRALTFHRAEASEAPAMIDWFLASKEKWLDAHHIRRSWLRRPEAGAFYKRLAAHDSGVEVFCLAVNETPVAVCICLQGARALEYYATTFDTDYGAYSPGNLLIEDLGRWCVERGLDFDFRITTDAYKLRWADGLQSFVTYALPCSPTGRLALLKRRIDRGVNRAHRVAGRLRRSIQRCVAPASGRVVARAS